MARDASGIDQSADQANPVDHLVEGGVKLVLIGHVCPNEDSIIVGEQTFGRNQRLLVDIDDRHRPAVIQKPANDGNAKARRATGDDCRMSHGAESLT